MMKTPRLLLLGLAAAGLFFGCQSTDSSPEPTGPQTITVPLKVPDTSRIPDSLVWRTKTEAGNRPVACSDLACPQAFVLKSALGATDTFHLELWQLGIREAGLRYLPAAGSNTLVQAGAAVADSTSVLALQLLASFRSYRLAHKDTLARPRPSDLVNYYALLLLDSAKVYAAGTVPTGMSRDSLQRALVLRAGRTGWTAAQLVARGLPGVTTESVRSVLAVLVQAKLVPDTTALFPPTSRPPVSDTTRPTIRRNAPANADTSVAWGVRSLRLSWTVTDDSSLAKVLLDDSLLAGAEGQYEKTVPLRVGGNTFVLQAFDARGNLRRDTVRVSRRADSTKPVVSLVSPPRDTIVDNAIASFAVAIQASDAESGIDSVKIGTKVVKTAPFAATIDLAVGANIVVLQAWNGAGTASETISVKIDRLPLGDTTRPTIRRNAPANADTSVAWGVRSLRLSWTVTDDSSLAKVLLDDSLLAGAEGQYEKTVPLRVGGNTFVLQTFDARGNLRRDTVRVSRRADSTKPVVSLVTPPRDTIVDNAIASFAVAIQASDAESGIDSVKIGTKVVKTAPFAATIDLAVGANIVVLQAWNGAGAASEAISVKIDRRALGDTTRPTILRVTPRSPDTTVLWGNKTMTFTWTVTDDSSLAKVLFDDSVLTGADGVFQKTVALAVGARTYTLTALDARGNVRRDSVLVRRLPDTTKPQVHREPGTRDTVVLKATTSFTPAWSVTDNALRSVTIGGAPVTGSGGIFSAPVGLVKDTTWIVLVASDSSDNVAKDSIRVRRVNDTTPPVVAFQKPRIRQVANAVISDTLVWTITDNLKMGQVVVLGTPVAPVGSTYSLVVSLAVGTHKYVLIATDSAGNTAKDTVVVARAALPPTHSAPDGGYIGTVYDTVTSAGADSIEISWDGTTWSKTAGPVTITGTGAKVLYSRAWPGGAMKAANWTLSQIRQVAMGGGGNTQDAYALYVKTDGSVWAAGNNKRGSFGITTPDIRSIRPIQVATGMKSVSAALGSAPSIFLRADGLATVITYKGSKQVSLANIETASYGSGAVFLRKDGSVWEEGFLFGYSDTGSAVPRRIPSVPGSISISTGSGLGLALDSNHWVWGFGIPSFGEKGGGTNSPIWEDTLTRVISIAAKSIAAGAYHSLVVKLDGSVEAAGLNSWGQLGKGTISDADSVFSPVAGVSDIKSVAAGWSYSLFLKADGSLYHSGMITTRYAAGYPQGESSLTPHPIASEVDEIWAGWDWCMFRKKDGTIWALGSNPEGAFGNGTTESSAVPVRINF